MFGLATALADAISKSNTRGLVLALDIRGAGDVLRVGFHAVDERARHKPGAVVEADIDCRDTLISHGLIHYVSSDYPSL